MVLLWKTCLQIKLAEIAFDKSPVYERYAPSQVFGFAKIFPLLLAEQTAA
jgi:hypothetical protein